MLDGRRKLPFSFAGVEEISPSPEPWRDGLDILVILSKIREQKRLLLKGMILGSLCFGLCGMGWLVLRSTAYSAGTEILIANTTLQLSGQDAVVTQLMVENTLLQSQILLARSNAVMERAIIKIGQDRVRDMLPQPGLLGQISKFFSFSAKHVVGSAEAQLERNALLQDLKASIVVARVGASQIIGLRARGSSPNIAAQLAQEVTQAFLVEMRDINAVVTTSGAFRERIRVLGPTARVISEAVPPIGKDGPRGLLILLLAPLLGGIVGCILALALAVMNRRVWSGEQLTGQVGAEFFGYIEASRRYPQEPLRQESSLTDALRRIRSAAIERRGTRPRIIGITSIERESKTTVAMGLALLLAGDDQRVLLIDAALRHADLSRRLGEDSAIGLQQVLHDPRKFKEALHHELRPCLDILPSGAGQNDLDTRWPSLLKSVDTAEKAYDWIILDMPPMEPATDLRAALCVLDDLVIVTERGVTSGSVLTRAFLALGSGRHKLIGTLINNPAPQKHWLPRVIPQVKPFVKHPLAHSPVQVPVEKNATRKGAKSTAEITSAPRFPFTQERV
jgi:Mrp family chromosome partitioning ATPase